MDKRADIFAFGAVLYELLTGKRAFEGETITETIAAVLKSEPDLEALPENTPWNIRTLLRRCLHKELNRRLQHIGDVRIEIEEALSEPTTAPTIEPTRTVQSPLWIGAIRSTLDLKLGLGWFVLFLVLVSLHRSRIQQLLPAPATAEQHGQDYRLFPVSTFLRL